MSPPGQGETVAVSPCFLMRETLSIHHNGDVPPELVQQQQQLLLLLHALLLVYAIKKMTSVLEQQHPSVS